MNSAGAWTMIDFIHSTQNIEDIRKSCCSSQGSFSFVFHYTARAVSGEHWWHWSNLSHIPTATNFREVYTRTWHPSLLKESIWVASSSEKPHQSVLPHSYSLLRLHSYSLPPEGLGSTAEISPKNVRRCWRICNFRSFFSDLPWPSPIAGIASSNAPRSAGGTLSSLESSLVHQSWSQTQCLQSQPMWAAAQRLLDLSSLLVGECKMSASMSDNSTRKGEYPRGITLDNTCLYKWIRHCLLMISQFWVVKPQFGGGCRDKYQLDPIGCCSMWCIVSPGPCGPVLQSAWHGEKRWR